MTLIQMFTLEDTMSTIITRVRKLPLVTFLILAYALSWTVEIPLALKAQGVIHTKVPFSLHYLAAYGPMFSALILTGLTGGIRGLQELLGRMAKWKVKPGWWLVALAPLGLYLLVAATLWLTQKEPIDLVSMGRVEFLPPLGLAALPM